MKKLIHKPLAFIAMLVFSLNLTGTFQLVAATAEEDDNTRPIIVVSMGDSYSSGEGIEPFYGQVDSNGKNLPRSSKIVNDDWIAHRSMYSWPSLLKVGDKAVRDHKMPLKSDDNSQLQWYNKSGYDSEMQWYFVAASGAVTWNFGGINEDGSWWGYYPHTTLTNVGTIMNPWFEEKHKDLDPQLKVFEDNNLYGKVDYVTMSIGGNDLDFVPIVMTSAGDTVTTDAVNGVADLLNTLVFDTLKVPYMQSPGFIGKRIKDTENKWNNPWKNDKGEEQKPVKESLKYAYTHTLDVAGAQADIIVAGYPELYYRHTNTATANEKQREIIDNFIIDMCDPKKENGIKKVIDDANKEIRKNYPELKRDKIHYVSVIDKFKDKGMDAPEEQWIDGVNFWGSEKLDELNPMGYSSVHPNKTGAEHYAELVNKKIEELEEIKKLERENSKFKSAISGYVYNNTDGSNEYNEETWKGIPDIKITVTENAVESVDGAGFWRPVVDKDGNNIETTTDSNGHYELVLPAGTYKITATDDIYGTQSISNVIVYENQVTYAEWIVFNGKFSSTTLTIPGEDPIHSYNSNAEWAWKAYDHPEFDTPDGYDKHIITEGDNIRMYGYLVEGYKDFLFVDDNNSSKRILDFDFQRDTTSEKDSENNWHSMVGGGFLFNTTIDEKENIIDGYYVLVTQDGLKLYKVDSYNLEDFRNNEWDIGEQLGVYSFDDKFEKHHIKLEVDSNVISLWDGDKLVIDGTQLPEIKGNGFGPITMHSEHDCEQRSYFTFSNITMSTM